MTDEQPIDKEKEDKIRKRQVLDDDFKAQLAIERYSDRVDVKELALRYKRAESVVSRAIASAFDRRLVEVRRIPQRVERVPELEVALTRRFPSLHGAIVAEVSDAHLDELHKYLGHAMADLILTGHLRCGEQILLGPGRSTFHMAERLRLFEPRIRTSDVKLVSACGDSYPFHDDPKGNVCLDSDANVNLLAQAFENQVTVGLISRSIFLSDRGEGKGPDTAWKREYFAHYWETPPSIAILGLGLVDANHQLALLTRDKTTDRFPHIKVPPGVKEKIAGLRGVDEGTSGCDAAEIAMHLFPASAVSDPGGQAKLESEIGELNRALFAPDAGHLNNVGAIYLVGGGVAKAPAIRHVLDSYCSRNVPDAVPDHADSQRRAFRIRMLCTDRACATQLLQSAHSASFAMESGID